MQLVQDATFSREGCYGARCSEATSSVGGRPARNWVGRQKRVADLVEAGFGTRGVGRHSFDGWRAAVGMGPPRCTISTTASSTIGSACTTCEATCGTPITGPCQGRVPRTQPRVLADRCCSGGQHGDVAAARHSAVRGYDCGGETALDRSGVSRSASGPWTRWPLHSSDGVERRSDRRGAAL